MSENPAPNWYPDPSGEADLRWWDGSQWTEFTHSGESALAATPSPLPVHIPAESPDPAAAQLQKKPRKKFWVLLTAGVASLALVTTAAIAIPAMMGSGEAVPTVEPVVANGLTYMPPIEIDLSKERNALFPANVDLTELHRSLEAAGEPVNYYNGVLDIYADRDLTVPVHAYESTFDASRGSGKMWGVRPQQGVDYAYLEGDVLDDSVPLDSVYFDAELEWSEYPEYWVKRSYDADGNKLEFPEVTQVIPKFDFERPAPVRPSFSKGAEDGAVKLSWTAPEYADKSTEYLILKSAPSSLAKTAEDDWTVTLVSVLTGETEYDSTDHRLYDSTQNAGLTIFSGDSADLQEYAGDGVWKSRLNTTKSRFGVVAKHNGQYSPLELVAPDSGVRAQPYEVANFQQFQTRDSSQKWNVGDLTSLETWMPITTLDGATRTMQVQIDPESLDPTVLIEDFDESGNKIYPDGVRMEATVLGTSLTTKYSSWVPEGLTEAEWMEQLKTHIATFNARSISEQAKTGGVLLTIEDADHTIDFSEYRKLNAATQTPETEFPVFGTHPMVEHIAANMFAGEKAIDVSKWQSEPGAPAAYDAYREAMTQNPLVNYGRPVVDFDGQKIYIDYVFEQEVREDAMRLSYEKAKEIAASVEGKSDEEKALAINRWVIDNTEYDYESLAAYEGGSLIGAEMPLGKIAYDSEFTAWSPIGVFRDGSAVCTGYAQAFTMIAREAGLDSIIVSGEVIEGGPHAWNRVKVDGTWKSLDPTWNDSDTKQNQYLLINEDDYTGSAERVADPEDNWILKSSKSKYDTP